MRAESGLMEKCGMILQIRVWPVFVVRAPYGVTGNTVHPPTASTRCRGSAACPAMVSYDQSRFPGKFWRGSTDYTLSTAGSYLQTIKLFSCRLLVSR